MVVCMAAPVSPRFRRNREKPAVKTVEAHGKIRRRRVSRSESLESRPTKKISPELALAVKHDLVAGHHELPLEERIKAIVIGNSREFPRRLAEKDMKNLCSSVEIQDWICKSFVEKNSVKGDKSTNIATKGVNCDTGEQSEDKLSRKVNQKPLLTQNDVDSKRQSSQSQYEHGSSSLVPRSRSVHIRKGDQSSQDRTIAQTHASSCQRNTTEPSGLGSSSTSDRSVTVKQKPNKSESVQEVGSSNITDAEKLMYKLRSSSIVRHKSLYSPLCNIAMLLPHPQSERGRSDDFVVRSPRSKSESRTLIRNSQAEVEVRRETAGYQSAREMSKTSTRADTKETSVSEKPKSPGSNKIVRKGSSLSRNRTDLFRAAKEHPGSISRLKEKFAKLSAAASQRKLSNKLSVTRRKKKDTAEPSSKMTLDKDFEQSVLQSAKELQSYRVDESPSDSKSNYSKLPNDLKPNQSRSASGVEHFNHSRSSSGIEQNHSRTSSGVEQNHSRNSSRIEQNHSRNSSGIEQNHSHTSSGIEQNHSHTEKNHSRTSSGVEHNHSQCSSRINYNHSRMPIDYDYYLRTPSRGEKQSAKDIQPLSYRGAESQRDDKPSHSRTLSKEEKVSGEARRKTSQTSTESGSGGHLIVRQCLIGTNLAFGLVQLNTGVSKKKREEGGKIEVSY